MEQTESKLKKWGWWAVAGLVGVLVIAGLIIAITSSGPKPTTEVAAEDTSKQEEPAKTEEEPDTSDDKPTTTTPELPVITPAPEADLPKTGPEDTIAPIIGAGALGYLLALGISTLRRRN